MPTTKKRRFRSRRIAGIVFGYVPPDAREDEKDVLVEVKSVARALKNLGYQPVRFPATLDISHLLDRIKQVKPAFLFNLVESLHGYDRLSYLVPSVFDACGIPYAGVNGDAQICTTNKLIAKAVLKGNSIPTPGWQNCTDIIANGLKLRFPVIVKPAASDASFGISDNSIIKNKNELKRMLSRLSGKETSEYFAEEYIDGREFNVSVISDFNGSPLVLPPAEIIFQGFPRGKPKIVVYNAKWAADSYEFSHTPRTFSFPASDKPLISALQKICRSCWQVFGLNGYVQVDFRIDKKGRPWVLEINGNPCISPDAGLTAAATEAGISYDGLVERIIANLNNA
jgi:D-alanine-D-alanine ligase